MIPAAPNPEAIRSRLREQLHAGVNPTMVTEDALTGRDDTISAMLAGLQAETVDWPLWRNLGLRFIRSGRALVVQASEIGNTSATTRVAEVFSQALTEAGWRGALVTTSVPTSAVWRDGPSGWLRLVCPPLSTSEADERVQISGFRLPLSAELELPGFTPVRLGRRTIGYAAANTLVLRCHPFLTPGGRLTASRPAPRVQLLSQLLALAAEHLPDVHTDSEQDPTAAWEQATRYAHRCLQLVRQESGHFDNQIIPLREQQREAHTKLNDLAARLEAAQREAAAADERASVLPQLERARSTRLVSAVTQMDTQYEAVLALPQVASARYADEQWTVALDVTTHPLVLDCGRDGHRRVPGVTFRLPIHPLGDPSFPPTSRRAPHPAVNHSMQMDWSAVSVPLAQALGTGDLRAATAIVCGLLARPLARLPRNRSSFRRAVDDARPGFALPFAA